MTTGTEHDQVDRATGDAPSRVAPMSALDDFEIADGYPEIRGWDVRDSAGRSIGYVYDVLVDLDAMRVRYLDVQLESQFAGNDADPRVLIPIENVGLDGRGDEVLLRGVDVADVHALVPYARRGVAREREVELPRPSAAADTLTQSPATVADTELDRDRHFDDERLFARDDVEVERRAVQPGEDVSAVTEERVIEADVRKERIEIDDPAAARAVEQMRRRRGGDRLLVWKDARRWRELTAEDVNDYLADIVGSEFTAKDFRTWHATVLAAVALAETGEPGDTQASRRRAVRAAMDEVAEFLGNSAAIVRSSYVDPRVVERYDAGVTISPMSASDRRTGAALQAARERAVLRLLDRT
jgi:sporulation protein YlmC with PRC-barrel domain